MGVGGGKQPPEGVKYFKFFNLKLITLDGRHISENFVEICSELTQISIN